ncbi:MAG TPA: MoxR family ATPase [Thermoanaerobaculia bacterium]|jgi:MoxR-like ATPase|nr:MoxR family ATPase [Thermoanaerobaculia bacterium]
MSASLDRLRETVGRVFRGNPDAIDLVLIAILSRGHVLIEDVPGVGKTTLARAIGKALDLKFTRIQFTSDTLPADVLGVSIYNASANRFVFHPGPIFGNVVLADEINRATPKTQSALLQAMNEGRVSTDEGTLDLPAPFVVIATQNPVEYLGTYPLPESQLDRFFLRLSLGYPPAREEKDLLQSGGAERTLDSVEPVLEPADLLALQARVEGVRVSDKLLDYVYALIEATRRRSDLRLPVSTRGAQAFYRAIQARALVAGRDFALPEDAQAVAEPVLSHRILSISSDGFGTGPREREVIKTILGEVPVPV